MTGPGQVTPDGEAEAPSDTRIGLLVEARIDTEELLKWATTPSCGAVVLFLGVVRDHAEGRHGVFGMTYEAYTDPALVAMTEVADAARRLWPTVGRIAIVHRVGDLILSDASVAVVVSSPHRAEAFEVGRFCIDTLKEAVPIWKKEHWSGGDTDPTDPTDPTGSSKFESAWALGAHDLRSVSGTIQGVVTN